MTDKLRECPFCGNDESIELCSYKNEDGDVLWWVQCDGLDKGCGVSTGRRKNAWQVEPLWNTRASDKGKS